MEAGRIITCIVVFLDFSDILFDWLFYGDLISIRPGLVYGPIEPSLITGLLITSVLSTILGIFHSTLHIIELCSKSGNNCFRWKNFVSLLVIWIGEFPGIVVSLLISGCRENSVSIFQMTKAAFILIGVALRIIMFCISWHKNHITIKNKWQKAIYIIASMGLIVNAGGSVTIFIFTKVQYKNNALQLETPTDLFDEITPNARYFANVSVYFQHHTFRDMDSNNQNFIRMFQIDEIRIKNQQTHYLKYEYRDTDTELEMKLSERYEAGPWQAKGCYRLDKSTNNITLETPCGSFQRNYNASITFALEFTPPEGLFKELIFGDILYNVASPNGDNTCQNIPNIHLYYYRTTVSEKHHLIVTNETVSFYSPPDLIDISKVWKTGLLECDSTGSLTPTLDERIDVPCNSNL